jgi:hypothetical protein
MAVVNLKSIILKDNWPGMPTPKKSFPTNGFDATVQSDTTTPTHPIGTKIEKYTDISGVQGWTRFIYLRYYCMSSANVVEDVSDGFGIFQQFCNSTCISADGTANAYTCTNKGDIDTGFVCGTSAGVVAVACSSLSSHDNTLEGLNGGGYGWFWCGGVCPAEITTLDCDVTGDGAIAAGNVVNVEVDTSALRLAGTDMSINNCGWSLKTDA